MAGGAGGAGDGWGERGIVGGAAETVGFGPCAEVWEPAGLAVPEGDGADGLFVFVFDPDGDVGAAVAVVAGAFEFEVDGEFGGVVPEVRGWGWGRGIGGGFGSVRGVGGWGVGGGFGW